MDEVMSACVGIADAISAGQDPTFSKKRRKRTVREVAEYVRKLNRAGIGVTFLNERQRAIKYDRREPVISMVLKAKEKLTSEQAMKIVEKKGTIEGRLTPLLNGVLIYPVD